MLLIPFLWLGCQSIDKRSDAYRNRLNMRLDSLCKANASLSEHLLHGPQRTGDQPFIHILHYRSMLSDFILETQYDDVPPGDSMHWVSELHLYHQYHQLTYGLLQDIAAKPSDSLFDLLNNKEHQIFERLQQMSVLITDSTFCTLSTHGLHRSAEQGKE